jgi:DNA-binding response OmpR family regulator
MKILIIEDEEKLAALIKKGLIKNGYAADYLLDGESAERRLMINNGTYDLAILDLMLPGKDGIEVCKDLRKYGVMIPILVLTAKNTTHDKIESLDGGADDYLSKPFDFSELLARVRALLRRPLQSLPVVLEHNGIELRSNERKVFFRNKEVLLTLKEFNLLEYFMRNPNQVLTRDQIIENLWGWDFDSFSNVLDVHVKNLRKKFNDIKSQKILETVRGIGYKFKT